MLPTLTTPQPALRSGARTFLQAFAAFTALWLGRQAWQRVPDLMARDVEATRIAELLLLCLPFIVALTLPAAVFLGALHSYARPELRPVMSRVPAQALRPLLLPALVLGLLTFGLINYLLPRTNTALRRGLLAVENPAAARGDGVHGDRELSIAEMARVVREAEVSMTRAMVTANLQEMAGAASRIAQYRVEIQKKLAISAAVLVLALLGAAVGPWLAGRGWWARAGVASLVFGLYYVGLVGGEALGNRRVVSPVLAMWGANLVALLATAVLLAAMAPPPQALSRSA